MLANINLTSNYDNWAINYKARSSLAMKWKGRYDQ